MQKVSILLLFAVFGLISCSDEPTYVGLDAEMDRLMIYPSKYLLPSSTEYDKIPQSPSNPLTKEKIELGNLLFFETAFANESKQFVSRGTFSCSTCHVVEAGFRPGRMQGIADGAYGFGKNGEQRQKLPTYPDDSIDAQGARPLATINVAFVENTMWNGSFGADGINKGTEALWGKFDPGTAANHLRIGALEGQNIEGLKVHRMQYTREIVEANGYKKMFDQAFPDIPESERYTRTTASFALSAYLRSITTDQAPFQLWLKGQTNAMSESEKRGAIAFFKYNCQSCHSEPNLGSMRFEALGVKDLFEQGGLKTSIADRRNLGRGGFTNDPEDMFRFRVPQLYNLGDGGPYFHGASKKTLEEVVRYFNDGVHENPRVSKEQLSTFLRPLKMSEQEIKDLTQFLETGLRDPNLKRYKPTRLISGMCFPNNDPDSRVDMGCN